MTIDTKAIRARLKYLEGIDATVIYLKVPELRALLDAYEAGQAALKEAEARGLEKAAQWHDEQAEAAAHLAQREIERAAQAQQAPSEAFVAFDPLANHHKECAAALRQRAKEQDNG